MNTQSIINYKLKEAHLLQCAVNLQDKTWFEGGEQLKKAKFYSSWHAAAVINRCYEIKQKLESEDVDLESETKTIEALDEYLVYGLPKGDNMNKLKAMCATAYKWLVENYPSVLATAEKRVKQLKN